MKLRLELESDVEPQVDYAPIAGQSPAHFKFRFGVVTVECHPVHAKVLLDQLAGELVKMEAMANG